MDGMPTNCCQDQREVRLVRALWGHPLLQIRNGEPSMHSREKPDTHATPAECSGSSVQLEADNRGKVKGDAGVYGDGPGAGDS